MQATVSAFIEMPTPSGRIFRIDAEVLESRLRCTWTDGESQEFRPCDMRWRWLGRNRIDYVTANVTVRGKGRLIYIHRLVAQAPADLVVDHINHDTANNLRSNLRLATLSENLTSQRDRRKRFCDFIGVRFVKRLAHCRRPFLAVVKKDGMQYRSLYFATQEEAAREYDRMATELYGQFARLNFPLQQQAQ
jgi:hypothetical protein